MPTFEYFDLSAPNVMEKLLILTFVEARLPLSLEQFQLAAQIFHAGDDRLRTLSASQNQLEDAVYWALLGFLWQESAIYVEKREILPFLSSNRPQRDMFTHAKADRELWAAQRDKILIYRGQTSTNSDGVYWSLCEDVAREFAETSGSLFREEGYVYYTAVNKADCLFRGGRQQEVIHLPQLWRVSRNRSAEVLSPRTVICSAVRSAVESAELQPL